MLAVQLHAVKIIHQMSRKETEDEEEFFVLQTVTDCQNIRYITELTALS